MMNDTRYAFRREAAYKVQLKKPSRRGPGLGRFYTIKEIAAALRYGVPAVRRFVKRGKLTAYRLGPRAPMRFRMADVLRFLRKQPDVISHEGKGSSSMSAGPTAATDP